MADHDVVVLGGGPAGLTAGLFAARTGLSVLVLEELVPGGRIVNLDRIEDFPGFPAGVAGYDLGPSIQEQADEAGAAFALARVTGLERVADDWLVQTIGEQRRAPAVIVATGRRSRGLGLSGEERFHGRGISHCASCDGPLHRGKPVGVVGSGDAAMYEALAVAQFASEVHLLDPGPALIGQAVWRRRIAAEPRIRPRHGVAVAELLGDSTLSGVRLDSGEQIELSALFVYLGGEANTELLRGMLPLAEDGAIETDPHMRAALPGLFAAGTVRVGAAGFTVTSAGDGATAAMAAAQYLKERTWR